MEQETAREAHWKHLMNAARRHAKERGERMTVTAVHLEYVGVSAWHYTIMSPASAAYVRGLR